MLKKEIRRFLDAAFDGAAAPLVAQLANMNEVTLDDIRELERAVTDREDDDAAD
jgi:predicted transcriptional regulator